MGAYSSLYLVPVDSPEWVPDREFMRSVLDLLGATCVHNLVGYAVPVLWENGYDHLKHVTFENLNWRVDPDTALRVWEEGKPLYADMCFFAKGYTDRLFRSLGEIPECVAGDVALGHLSFCIGPFSIPSIDCRTTLGRYSFAVEIGGSGAPDDPDHYLEAVKQDPEMRKLLRWLQEKSGTPWDVLMTCSC